MRVGTVARGYADGYPRHAGHRHAPVLVDGQRFAHRWAGCPRTCWLRVMEPCRSPRWGSESRSRRQQPEARRAIG